MVEIPTDCMIPQCIVGYPESTADRAFLSLYLDQPIRNGWHQLISLVNPIVYLSHIPQCTIQNRNVHICVLNGALWDVGCGTGVLWNLWDWTIVGHVPYPTDSSTPTKLGLWSSLSTKGGMGSHFCSPDCHGNLISGCIRKIYPANTLYPC